MDVTLHAEKRETRGKNAARRLRAAGRLPAIVYGGGAGQAPLPVTVDPRGLSRLLHSESGINTLIDLVVEGEGTQKVLVKDFLVDPVSGRLLHADFYRVALDRPITLRVPVHLVGEARGVKQQGGVLDFVTREIELQVLPTQIPEAVNVDVSDLGVGQAIRVRDLARDAPWTAVTEGDVMVVHVVAQRVSAEQAAAAQPAEPAATGSEPEVIRKGKGEKAES